MKIRDEAQNSAQFLQVKGITVIEDSRNAKFLEVICDTFDPNNPKRIYAKLPFLNFEAGNPAREFLKMMEKDLKINIQKENIGNLKGTFICLKFLQVDRGLYVDEIVCFVDEKDKLLNKRKRALLKANSD